MSNFFNVNRIKKEKEQAQILIEATEKKELAELSVKFEVPDIFYKQDLTHLKDDFRLRGIAVPERGKASSHGLFTAGFMRCEGCPISADCDRKNIFLIGGKDSRCDFEREFFVVRYAQVTRENDLDGVDKDSLIRVLFNYIRLRRVDMQLAKTPYSKHLVFNPKTGSEHEEVTANILFPVQHRLESEIRDWLESLKLSRKSKEPVEQKNSLTLIFNQYAIEAKIINQKESDSILQTNKIDEKTGIKSNK